MVDSVNIQSGIDPTAAAETEAARVAAATATFNAQATPPVATPATPELIGGKFTSNAELLAAYKSLEAKLGAPKDPPAVVTPTETGAEKLPPVVSPDPAKLTIDATAAAASAGFKMADLSAEYSANGDLTPATYEKLSKAGIGKDMVDAFVAGQRVIYEAENNAVMTKAGVTKESFADMVKWAGANLPPEDIKAYNDAVSGPSGMKQLALEAMHTRFTRAQGSDPVLFRGERGASTSGDVYRSHQQMVEAMKDPRYTKDPAYRDDVYAKAARSKFS